MELEEYKGTDLIGWMGYDPTYEEKYVGSRNSIVYVYPQVRSLGAGRFAPVDPADFPERGSVRVWLSHRESAREMCDRLKRMVIVQFRTSAITPYEKNTNNKYSFKYSEDAIESEISISSFEGSGFWQVIPAGQRLDAIVKSRSAQVGRLTLGSLWTTGIMLRLSNGSLYGPFTYDTDGTSLRLFAMPEHDYMVGEYSGASTLNDLYTIHDEKGSDVATFIPQSSIMSRMPKTELLDWLPDDALIDAVLGFMNGDMPSTREQRRRLRSELIPTLAAGMNLHGISLTEDRIKRAKDLVDSSQYWERSVGDIVGYALHHSSSRTALINELVDHQFEHIKPELIERGLIAPDGSVQENEQLRARVEALQDANDRLSRDNKRLLETSKMQALVEENEERYRELQSAIAQMETEYALKSRQKQILDNEIRESVERFNSEAKQTARLLDSKILETIVHMQDHKAHCGTPTAAPAALHDPMSAEHIIERVAGYVREQAKREVSDNEVANYLICLTQGFITTFAGEPGTGKTSLCTILAKSLGLAASDSSTRFTDVAVERGWTSHKDLIGYYNPLTGVMERSNADVYDALALLDRETDEGRHAPYFILLDEANLSPIEHYWAAFLKLCDADSAASRHISLGGPEHLRIPRHLRFLATVNFDHTTEELSPRFLDRTWVITLDPSRIDEECDEEAVNMPDMVPYESLQVAFAGTDCPDMDIETARKWENIQEIFRNRALPIMPRNLRMVRRYCMAASTCMQRDTPGTRFAPLDFAVAQKILPTLNGNGRNYKLLVDDLLNECSDLIMPLTAKHLTRIKDAAERNLGVYQFFAR